MAVLPRAGGCRSGIRVTVASACGCSWCRCRRRLKVGVQVMMIETVLGVGERRKWHGMIAAGNTVR